MRFLRDVSYRPNKSSINPELIVELRLMLNKLIEFPLEISGDLLVKEGEIKIGNVIQADFDLNHSIGIGANNIGRRNGGNEEIEIPFKFTIPLTEKSINFIQDTRSKNSPGNVDLVLKMNIKMIQSNVNISYLKQINFEKLGLKNPLDLKNAQLIIHEYSSNFNPGNDTSMWIFSGNVSPAFMKIQNFKISINISIPSSDWVNDFCPIYNVGDFLIYELPLLEIPNTKSDLDEKLKRAIEAINNMKKHIINGDWKEVIKSSRPIWELTRNEAAIKNCLITSGYNEEVYNAFNSTINGLFKFSSKFIHELKLGKSQALLKEVNVSKEDAYMIYSSSVNIVYLISKKILSLK